MKRALLLLLLLPIAARADDGLRLDFERHSMTATYRYYTQVINGLDVAGVGVIERVEGDGSVKILHRQLAHAPSVVRRRMAASEAVTSLPQGIVRDTKLVAVNVDGEARTAWRIVVEPTKYERVAHFVDASTGAILRSEPLFARVQARVFDLNPIAKLNRPDLADANNAAGAVSDNAYSIVDLDNLVPSGPLTGPYVRIADLDSPTTTPADASKSLLFTRDQPQFEEVNAYFQIDRIQRYLVSLGYSGTRQLVAYRIPVDPHAANGTDNSYFLREFTPGQGQLLFGDGGTDDAEDSDIMLHEFGHAIQEWIAPGAFTGASSTQPPALGEGFADYWSFSSTYAATTASGRDPFCIGDWDARCAADDPSEHCGYPAGANCLRRVDGTKTMSDYIASDASGTEHKNGEIWSSALREIFMAMTSRYGIADGKRMCDTMIIEGTFGTPPNPTYAVMARKLLAADTELNQGANAQTICSAMTTRRILQPTDCSGAPRGEITILPASNHGVAIPDNNNTGVTLRTTIVDGRSIEKLYVGIDIAHTSRGDLDITLVGPDGTTAVLLKPSLDRTANLQATYGLDAQPADSLDVFHGHSAAGEWKLVVRDVKPRDSGTLLSWSLQIQFVGDTALSVRPSQFAPRRFIPVVAHVPGANDTNFATDVRIFNRSSLTQLATLVFTKDGDQGWDTFTAVKIELAPKQTIALDDVVSRTMRQPLAGGNLDVVGDSDALLVSSRTYTTAASGTYGQSIPSVLTTSGIAAGDAPRHLVPLVRSSDFRSNIGFSEVDGGIGIVRFTFFDASGNKLTDREYTVQPFMHMQTVADVDNVARAEVRVISGEARVIAYASVVDNRSGDGTYVEAQAGFKGTQVFLAPAIHADGVNGTAWRTDVTLADVAGPEAIVSLTAEGTFLSFFALEPGTMRVDADVVKNRFASGGNAIAQFVHGTPDATVVAATRTWTDSDHGSYGVSIPFVRRDDARPPLAPPLDIIHLDSTPAFRTNIGIVEVDNASTVARLIVYDAAGNELARRDVDVAGGAVNQLSLRSILSDDVYAARISIENVGGTGRIFSYGSVVDNASGDPIYIAAQ